MTIPLLLAFLASACLATPGPREERNVSGAPLPPEQRAYDVRYYDLAVEVDPEQRTIEGSLTVRVDLLEDLDVLVLDLDPALEVRGAWEDADPREVVRDGGRLRVSLRVTRPAGTSVEVRVAYGGTPREAPRPPWEGGFTWSRTETGAPWIATTCQGEGGDLWWPCKDHPADEPDEMAIHVTVPDDLVVASNGRLVSVDPAGPGKHTYHWFVSTPIQPYLVALNIAPYATVHTVYESVDGSRFPVTFWALPERVAKARALLPEVLEHLRFFEERFGPYPFRADKYGVVETPHLGMEHQTIIAYGYGYQQDPTFEYDWLHHHELSHEWWGNLVTNADWSDMWIHEGIGTYCQNLYVEEKHGPEAYRRSLAAIRPRLENERPVAPEASRNSAEIYFSADGGHDNDIYFKGAWVLHTLRWLVGDEDFFTILRRMAYPDPALELVTDGRQCRTVTTEDFVELAEEITGRELRWFFDVYLRQPALPTLVVEDRGEELFLAWEVPGDRPFPMPVPVVVGGEPLTVVPPPGGTTVPVGGATHAVDPDGWVLRAEG